VYAILALGYTLISSVLRIINFTHAGLQIADCSYVLEAGRLAIAGPAAELMTDQRVRRACRG